MFTLDAGDELDLVVETARKLAEVELVPRLRESEQSRAVAVELRAAWDEVGLAGLELPEASGGAGFGCLARVLVNEELAAGDAGAALALDRYGPALTTLLEVGGEPAVARLQQVLGEGAARAVFVGPGDGSIERAGDRVTISVPWIASERVDAAVLLHGDEALLLTEGLVLEPLRGAGLRAAGAARLGAVGAPIAARWSNPEGAVRALARARLYYASLLLGVMRAACEFAAAYSQEREAFGKPIGHHQALAFLLTDMRMALDAARLLVHEAAWRADRTMPCAAEAASAWAECIEASRQIGPGGVQVLGGHGFMADYPVEKHMREARALGLRLGGFDAAIEDAGRVLIASDAPLRLGVAGSL
ncbi:MAG: acyl-CoA dehydrogenase family protein [Proteobacteria bacterium]|nr:acyl-CoA dehydrogenase family protein [Pseudomonadota bacterium]